MRKPFLILYLGIIVIIAASCQQDDISRLKNVDLSGISITIDTIKRYEQELYGLSTQPGSLIPALHRISGDYEVFTGNYYEKPDQILKLTDYLNDPDIQVAFDSVKTRFPDLHELQAKLTGLMKHYKYHFPEIGKPEIYTYISGYSFEEPVIILDNAIIIALDLFLNPGFDIYKKLGIPNYMQHKFVPERIAPEVARALSIKHLPREMASSSLLQNMIEAGKSLYFTDALLPNTPDYLKIGFEPEEIKWCKMNETQIWAYLIERKQLFTNDNQIIRDFMMDGPFIPGMPNESPGELGHWIGWQIVREFMKENPQTSLQELMQMKDAQEILRKSGYKPRR